jgi:hypothetical protein
MESFNKIFGRDFVVGFFVPAAMMIAALAGILDAFGILPAWLRINGDDPLKDGTFLALLAIVAAFFLMAGNRMVFRTLEGYWVYDIGRRLNHFQRWKFRSLKKRINELNLEYKQCEIAGKPFTKQEKRRRLSLEESQHFPSTESQVLPTAFGNAVRAFEDYPRVMYGFTSINGWSRLNAFIPKTFQEILGNRRATTDFWVNVWFVSLFTMAEYFVVAVKLKYGILHEAIPLGCVALAVFAAGQARSAAVQWGEWVKAAFDIYLPSLRTGLGLARQSTVGGEKDMWLNVSRAFIYRDPESLRLLQNCRSPEASNGEGIDRRGRGTETEETVGEPESEEAEEND